MKNTMEWIKVDEITENNKVVNKNIAIKTSKIKYQDRNQFKKIKYTSVNCGITSCGTNICIWNPPKSRERERNYFKI